MLSNTFQHIWTHFDIVSGKNLVKMEWNRFLKVVSKALI